MAWRGFEDEDEVRRLSEEWVSSFCSAMYMSASKEARSWHPHRFIVNRRLQGWLRLGCRDGTLRLSDTKAI